MTNPGFMGQRAGQQASASLRRGAQQTAATNYNTTVRSAIAAGRRNGARPHYRPSPARGVFGAIRWLIGAVFSLVIIAIAIGIFLMVLSAAAPDWFGQVKSLFDQTF